MPFVGTPPTCRWQYTSYHIDTIDQNPAPRFGRVDRLNLTLQNKILDLKIAQQKIINPQNFNMATSFSTSKAYQNSEYSSFQSGLIAD